MPVILTARNVRETTEGEGKVRKRLLVVGLLVVGVAMLTGCALLDQFITLAGQHELVYLDLAGVVMNWKIEDAVRRLGSERLLFGTDGPYPTPDPVARATGEIARIRMLRLSDDEKANILGRNAARLLAVDAKTG